MKKITNFLGFPLIILLGTACIITVIYFFAAPVLSIALGFVAIPFILILCISLLLSLSYIIVGIMRSLKSDGKNMNVDSGTKLLYRGLCGLGLSFLIGFFAFISTAYNILRFI
jgi:hypothetical protein